MPKLNAVFISGFNLISFYGRSVFNLLNFDFLLNIFNIVDNLANSIGVKTFIISFSFYLQVLKFNIFDYLEFRK